MRERQGDGSTKVFNHASVLRGSEQTRASDHLPVSADFIFEGATSLPPVAEDSLAAPQPHGPDEGREQVTIDNGTAEEVDLAG